MKESYLILDFVGWYYTRAFRDILAVWSNVMWFLVHFFSIPLLLRTLFSPWKRMTDQYQRTGMEDLFETLVMNMMSRVFGAFVRLLIVGCGIFFLMLGVVSLFVVIVTWVFMPVLTLVSLLYGVMIFFV
jgi:hypothetical protein